MSKSQRAALNDGTSANYLNYLKPYKEFCTNFSYKAFPLREITLSMFAQYLSSRLKPQSIRCVVSSLRTLSTTIGYSVPEKQFPMVNLTLRGLGKLNPTLPERANLMTARILLDIRENLDLSDKFEATMWALFTTCFFLLLRKSNVTPDKPSDKGYMKCKHIQKTDNGFLVTLYWTKTIQAGERNLLYPILKSPGSKLCPAAAIDNMLQLVQVPGDKPAFCYENGSPILYSTFNNFLKLQIKKLGMNTKGWSTHCFRHGDTTYLAACGISDQKLKILGDWKSDCFKKYVRCPWQDKLNIATKIRDFLTNNTY